MPAHRDAAFGEEAHCPDHSLAAFQLDHLRARRHQLRSVGTGFLRTDLESTEWHVADDECLFRAARDTAGVVHHVGQRNGQRGFIPLQHHTSSTSTPWDSSNAAKLAS